jgi:hypothetical protein
MNYTPRKTYLHCLAAAALIAPAAFARNFGPAGQNASQNNSAAPAASASATSGAPAAPQIVVAAGTRLPLVLHNSITTRNAKPGDPLYLETTFPIMVNDRIVIPAGTFVQGEITEAKRAAKGKESITIETKARTPAR